MNGKVFLPEQALLDEKFQNNKAKYILQCSLTTISVFILLLLLDIISDRVVVASLGASAFIVFTMPHARASSPRLLLAGYAIGIAAAGLCVCLSGLLLNGHVFIVDGISYNDIFGALAVGLSVFLMVVTNSEHPPAAGLALGLVMDGCPSISILVAAVGIAALTLIKTALKRYMIDLL
ncbi:MAG: HPP family protein [Clostridia bacterium]|jgi:CBS-domain-containing membrane protein|nr:HPP family protein [Clostridia bacterium]